MLSRFLWRWSHCHMPGDQTPARKKRSRLVKAIQVSTLLKTLPILAFASDCFSHMALSFLCLSKEEWKLIDSRNHNRGRRPKRALLLVLGLSLWYGTISLFLEQIAPSRAAHARTWCEDFCGCSAGKWRPIFPKCLMLLAHNSKLSCLLEFCFSVFVVSCSSLSEGRQCQI